MKRPIVRLMPLLVVAVASILLLAAVLWERSPVLAVALVGPLLALVLYERSVRRGRAAMTLALTDPLTGLGNQRAIRNRLEHELARSRDPRRPTSLCILDVDGFKRINDGRGHPVGDLVLRRVADVLRRDGEAFRLGGDEFGLVLRERAALDAALVANAIVSRIASLDGAATGPITVSAGLATAPTDATTCDELIACADERLYRAKRNGGNRVDAGADRVAVGNES